MDAEAAFIRIMQRMPLRPRVRSAFDIALQRAAAPCRCGSTLAGMPPGFGGVEIGWTCPACAHRPSLLRRIRNWF